jgi:methyltransferase (TIGR00027 family)
MSAAVARGTHRLWDDPPWIFDDPIALDLAGEGWEEFAAASRALAREVVVRRGQAGVLVRSRYPEDRLAEGTYDQYVILSAGLDSFHWRRQNLTDALRVFEVDHPATQAWKRERIAKLGLAVDEGHVWVPLDFETQSLSESLDSAGFDRSRPAMFAWVGTTMYLTRDSIELTLRFVATCAEGSEIAISYNQETEFVDDIGREFLAAISPLAVDGGEPILTEFSPTAMEQLVRRCGLTVVDHPTTEDLTSRYCTGRSDGLRPYTLERLISARRASESGA